MARVSIHLNGVHALLGNDLGRMVELAQRADGKGIDGVSVPDHLASHGEAASRYPGGAFPPLDYPWFEPTVTLAAIAATTRRIRLSMGILIAPLRPALLLAKQLATLDVLSRGRVDAGFGAGWMREEFEAIGVPFEGRFGLLEEQVLACRALWNSAPASFEGRHIRFADLHCIPRPAQGGGIPVWLGLQPGPTSFARIARLGAGWLPMRREPAQLAGDIETLRQAFAAAGRDPGEVRVRTSVQPEADQRRGAAAVDSALERARRYAAAGAGVLEFYPARLCRDEAEIESLLDQLVALKASLA